MQQLQVLEVRPHVFVDHLSFNSAAFQLFRRHATHVGNGPVRHEAASKPLNAAIDTVLAGLENQDSKLLHSSLPAGMVDSAPHSLGLRYIIHIRAWEERNRSLAAGRQHHDAAPGHFAAALRSQAMLFDQLMLEPANVRILRRKFDGLAKRHHAVDGLFGFVERLVLLRSSDPPDRTPAEETVSSG